MRERSPDIFLPASKSVAGLRRRPRVYILSHPERDMSKRKLCKWDKARIKKDYAKLKKIVGDPHFVCSKCARVSIDSSHLCRPQKLDE
jgi:hypothetical protein